MVHVAVTMFDADKKVVEKLGLLEPWICTASLILGGMQSQRYSVLYVSAKLLITPHSDAILLPGLMFSVKGFILLKAHTSLCAINEENFSM